MLYAQMNATQRQTIKVVHITDFHTDSWYEEGSIADCGGRYCCRNDTYKGVGTIKAGKFGAPEGPCDIPVITVNQTLKYIRDIIKPDAVFWTGDNSPHDRVTGEKAIYETAYSTNVTAALI